MPPVKSARKPAAGAPGVKMFITAASLAATLGGWALISAEEVQPLPPEQLAVADQAAAGVTIQLAPLPTLVPLAQTAQQTQGASQPAPISPPRPASRAAAASASQAAAPQPAAPVLRDVSAPALANRSAPAPVTNTRSSR